MKEAYELVEAIQWHEGMLLTPQHFQQMALRQEQLVYYYAGLAQPFLWGIRHLKIDPVLLVNGRLNILELEALLPDGLMVWHLAGGEEPLELDLTPHQETLKDVNLTVYLAVPARRAEMNAAQGDLSRYRSVEGRPISDDNTGEGGIHIPRLKPCLQLLISEDEPAQKYTWIPLARVHYKNESYALTDFIPPTLAVMPGTPLHDMGTVIATRVREKAAFLAEKMRIPAYSSRMDKPMRIEAQSIIQGLVNQLPQLEAYIYSNTGHPHTLFMTLCAMAGSLAGYAASMLPPVFPAYNHNDLRSTFGPLDEFLNKLLDSIHETYTVIPFILEDNLFTITPESEWLEKRFVIGVRGKPGSTDSDLIDWVEDAVIGSGSLMQALREKRVLGAGRSRIDKDDEMELTPSKGVLLFEVKVDAEFIRPDDTLSIQNTSQMDEKHLPAEIVFYVPNIAETEE